MVCIYTYTQRWYTYTHIQYMMMMMIFSRIFLLTPKTLPAWMCYTSYHPHLCVIMPQLLWFSFSLQNLELWTALPQDLEPQLLSRSTLKPTFLGCLQYSSSATAAAVHVCLMVCITVCILALYFNTVQLWVFFVRSAIYCIYKCYLVTYTARQFMYTHVVYNGLCTLYIVCTCT